MEKYFLSDEVQQRLQITDPTFEKNVIGTTKPEFRTIGQRDLVYKEGSIMGALVATDYKQPKQIFADSNNIKRLFNIYGEDKGTGFAGNVWDKEYISPTITTCLLYTSRWHMKQVFKLSKSQVIVLKLPSQLLKNVVFIKMVTLLLQICLLYTSKVVYPITLEKQTKVLKNDSVIPDDEIEYWNDIFNRKKLVHLDDLNVIINRYSELLNKNEVKIVSHNGIRMLRVPSNRFQIKLVDKSKNNLDEDKMCIRDRTNMVGCQWDGFYSKFNSC